ncbi:hypothetical protein INT44_000465 [Umbelopsis vinacea]|uniref:Bola-like protein n=1 Tax=Umbelopsis vinacea TaxID=44442 RepID=A0A8H7U8I3_9FUNG|nr:hypothetical protein INT44_000465 [Umbelopsis vinacea]
MATKYTLAMSLPTLTRLCSRPLLANSARSFAPLRSSRFYSTESESASLSEGEKHIFDKLTKELSPARLRVVDVSGGCGSMYAIDIASEQFKGLSIVKQHRKINEILKEEIKGMHGLQV